MIGASLRFGALETIIDRQGVNGIKIPDAKISEYFGTNVFNDAAMREYLAEDVYEGVIESIDTGQKIDRDIADQVSSSMKAWALNKGATHYTHWFQPLTGATAEKHDSFFTPTSGGRAIENFNGNELVQQEPDASSFPSGGLRSTFEARGYTAWDPSSPAFIMEIGAGKTLCIPTIFVSYTGEALDYKAPLLKSLHLLDQTAVEVARYFDKNVKKVRATLGWEQEYFIVDEALYFSRPDLLMTGRTLFGSPPAKGQQLEDHYFGSIPERVYAFMLDYETEALKLGIPLSTRHNEVAPSQFEAAPYFEEANLSVDHNQLVMDLMDRVAKRHKLRLLLHEKPYAKINGSGKHNNWSIMTDTGKNLLSPGSTPKTNLQFLTFFVNTIKAVHDYSELLRASIASSGNDFRLGANEAPPAIISVYIGKVLEDILHELETRVTKKGFTEEEKIILKLDIHSKIPDLFLDNTDRNRTSPFAFTGNKFELRAVGSSANCSSAMIVLNTIVANQLKIFKEEVDELIKKGAKKDGAILKVLSECIKSSKSILFGGDNYSDDWVKEAKKRGLENIKDSPRALDAYITKKTKDLFRRTEIFTERELHARHNIRLDNYIKKLEIEAGMISEIATTQIIPVALKYQNELISNVNGLKTVGIKANDTKFQKDLIKKINNHVAQIDQQVKKMNKEVDNANKITDHRACAIAYCDKIKPYYDSIRTEIDALELVIDDSYWPLPKYRELLFVR
ncbi:MAG: glutamine synthetase III [Bacteroidetes bacterium]|nr:glutamine synthetase III [Bacteroidota bacterium]